MGIHLGLDLVCNRGDIFQIKLKFDFIDSVKSIKETFKSHDIKAI